MDALLFRLRNSPVRRLFPAEKLEPPLRSQLFSRDLLHRHARTLAQQHKVGGRKGLNLLLPRLTANERILRDYNDETVRVEHTRRITPASEWLLDNFHLIEEQIHTTRKHLPRGYSRELPHLVEGPSANFPRVYDLALELISHTDGRIDAEHLTGFLSAYQEVTRLNLGELWAIPIMLRLALIENLRRVAALLSFDRKERDSADEWADHILEVAEANPPKLIVVVGDMARANPPLNRAFVAEFWRRMQEKSAASNLALGWIEERLREKGLTIEQLVQTESQNQAASQASVGNSVCSLRFLDVMDWCKFVESQSIVELTLRTDPAQVYGSMDFPTRDIYRHTIERISRHSNLSELEVSMRAIELARSHNTPHPDRKNHVGYYLAGDGVSELEDLAGMGRSLSILLTRFERHHPLTLYLGSILILSLAVTMSFLHWASADRASWWLWAVLFLLAFGVATQLSVTLVNWFVTIFVHPRPLARMDFSKGIPTEHATFVVVPTLLTSHRGIESLLEALEVRYLSNRDDHVFFALLTDFRDSHAQDLPDDDKLVQHAVDGIKTLNNKYRGDRPCIFYLFHRRREWNEADQVWMGYERKRGKLAALNRSLRTGDWTAFSHVAGDPTLLPRIQYVITLDTDTQLPREAARQLAATMAHPLNRPRYDSRRGLIVDGYSILQPRVAVSLPCARQSTFVALFSGEPGLDPYTRAVSDVYQDLFHEGSFIGKGIYDVDAFELAVGGKFPENRILSHDLLEGSYARAALVSDVQLFEEFPSRYSADSRRRHRWMRGDWQIAAWLLPRLPGPDVRRVNNPLTGLSRWKIFDNLRRSLVPIALVALLVIGWLRLPEAAVTCTGVLLAVLAAPAIVAILSELLRKPSDQPLRMHFRWVGRATARQLGQTVITITFLLFDACVSLDAVVRTLGRLMFTHRKLLEWQSASEVEQREDGTLKGFFRTMWCSTVLSLALGGILLWQRSEAWWVALPFLTLWALAPVAAWWISLPTRDNTPDLSREQLAWLRILARKTWRYFELYMGKEDNWLPPDNFQVNPQPVIATRTSPTNIGLGLLSSLSAYDFGYISLGGLLQRITSTMDTLDKLEKYQGHFYNWYDTRTLQMLTPLYVSTVDNGNLSGALFTLHSGLLEIADQEWNPSRLLSGFGETLALATAAAKAKRATDEVTRFENMAAHLSAPADGMDGAYKRLTELRTMAGDNGHETPLQPQNDVPTWSKTVAESVSARCSEVESLFPGLDLADLTTILPEDPDIRHQFATFRKQLLSPKSLRKVATSADSLIAQTDILLKAIPDRRDANAGRTALSELKQHLAAAGKIATAQVAELESLALRCDEMARMNFRMLFDTSSELLSIGYNVSQHRMDSSSYDLLASEARLASFISIALGQIPQKHWFTLGRQLTAANGHPTLISWSGSMFEYLMPVLLMPNYEGTLISLSCRSAVARQIEYGRQLDVPWGISESAYNLRDTASNYQYRAFGVPGLGFKRGLAGDIVIAPYATMLALTVTPHEAYENLARLASEGAEGELGFYESIDYTPSRVPRGQTRALVQCYMAHHQGMSLLALSHLLLDKPMQRRFTSNPVIRSADLLLHERVPKDGSILYPHELEADATRESSTESETALRIFKNPNLGPPEVQLLSNGRYHVMVTNSGGGYSHWNNNALTRWREDPTRDCWGTFLYVRDVDTGAFWSAAHQPSLKSVAGYEAIFSQGRAEFRWRMDDLDVHTQISVSPEDDVEVRRVILTNHSELNREIELTTYAEVVLNSTSADLSHPAFSSLFVETNIIRDCHAVICTRRPRSSSHAEIQMFYLLLVKGTEVGEASYETDRNRFIGRARDASCPVALCRPGGLTNSEGSVLDPVAALRRTVRIGPRETASFTLVAGVASTQSVLKSLIEKYQDLSIADRCFELAWTHGSIVLRHLNATPSESQLYERLAGNMIYNQRHRRGNASMVSRNQRGQRNLWSFGISGDLPIVLVKCSRADRLDLVRQAVQAHAYWRMKGLISDLVILTAEDSVYRQSLHDQILSSITGGTTAAMIDKPGGIFTRAVDQLATEDVVLLESVARLVLSDGKDGLLGGERAQRRIPMENLPAALPLVSRIPPDPPFELPTRELRFFNGFGGFTPDGREYVITVPCGEATPAPWVNVLSNPLFGTVVSESGSAYSWGENCHEFRLTPWHNDPIVNGGGEAFYIRDDQTGRYWSPTAFPARGKNSYIARHGFGYSTFEHTEFGISSMLTVFVATDAPVKFASMTLRNIGSRRKRLSIIGYWEWVLGELQQRCAMHVCSEYDGSLEAMLVTNAFNTDFSGRVAFIACSEPLRSYTGDRTEFVGRNQTLAHPAALGRISLSNKVGPLLDPCGALHASVELAPDEERELVFILGVGTSADHARHLVSRYRTVEAGREALQNVWSFWNHTLGKVYVETPEPALNILANGWLLYQTLACRYWARTGFYQSGGAFGFRDQLQDAMAFAHSQPGFYREHLLRAASHQFREGDVQHWWHPPHDRGVRTHFSDDYLWLPYATCRYVKTLGDPSVLDEVIPFLDGRLLRRDEEAYFDTPSRSSESGTLYEHCRRAIRHGLKFGTHGLPLIGGGDWNDGMNLVGHEGKGESVWLGFFLYDVLNQFQEIAHSRNDTDFARECKDQAERLRKNLEDNGWDGEWYRRAYFDNGDPLGSSSNPECQIDLLPQSWAVLSGAADADRAKAALASALKRLVNPHGKLIQLFDPPFDTSPLEPGYIKGYVPGVRENGAQYTHAAVWAVMACAEAGELEVAWDLFRLINPVLHGNTAEGIARYKVEPYVVAADIYSLAPHTGRGGWSWYTGSSGWMYRLVIETLLGVRREGDRLTIVPRAPREWSSYTLHYNYMETRYRITLRKSDDGAISWGGHQKIAVDGQAQSEEFIRLVNDRTEHNVDIECVGKK